MKRNIETIRDRVDVLRNNTENADRNSFLVIYQFHAGGRENRQLARLLLEKLIPSRFATLIRVSKENVPSLRGRSDQIYRRIKWMYRVNEVKEKNNQLRICMQQYLTVICFKVDRMWFVCSRTRKEVLPGNGKSFVTDRIPLSSSLSLPPPCPSPTFYSKIVENMRVYFTRTNRFYDF